MIEKTATTEKERPVTMPEKAGANWIRAVCTPGVWRPERSKIKQDRRDQRSNLRMHWLDREQQWLELDQRHLP